MGYTHYWYRQPKLDAAKFKAAVDDFRKLLPELRLAVKLADEDGNGEPLVSDTEIRFNGIGREGHEAFRIAVEEHDRMGGRVLSGGASGDIFAFCKTAQKPYDLAVCCALVVLRHHLGGSIAVMSDGCSDDWISALDLVQETLGYGTEIILDGDRNLVETDKAVGRSTL